MRGMGMGIEGLAGAGTPSPSRARMRGMGMGIEVLAGFGTPSLALPSRGRGMGGAYGKIAFLARCLGPSPLRGGIGVGVLHHRGIIHAR